MESEGKGYASRQRILVLLNRNEVWVWTSKDLWKSISNFNQIGTHN